MSLHLHALGGYAPAPLTHYRKALAILRLVSESKLLRAGLGLGFGSERQTAARVEVGGGRFKLHKFAEFLIRKKGGRRFKK